MTKLLEQTIAKARELSEAKQDAIADALFAHLPGGERPLRPERRTGRRRVAHP